MKMTVLEWEPQDETFVGEVSDMGPGFKPEGPIYVSDPDEGGHAIFGLERISRHEHGPVRSWCYTSFTGLKLIIFNDVAPVFA